MGETVLDCVSLTDRICVKSVPRIARDTVVSVILSRLLPSDAVGVVGVTEGYAGTTCGLGGPGVAHGAEWEA